MHIGSVNKLYAIIFCFYFADLVYSVSAVFFIIWDYFPIPA